MSPLRANILAAKDRMAEGYRQIQRRHVEGAAGVEVSAALTDLRDDVLLALYRDALEEVNHGRSAELAEHLALVAHGGYGRRDVAPFSDVDLMILHDGTADEGVTALAERLLRDVFDAGLILGHSVCTSAQACSLAIQDPLLLTSLGESRLLTGNSQLFTSFYQHFQRQMQRRRGLLMEAIDRARNEERTRFGETVFLLEPNLKRSRGTLRDLQLLRWLGFVRYGVRDPAQLHASGRLSKQDLTTVSKASEFLLCLRNELQFYAGKAGDVLSRAEQVRIAELRGYPSYSGMLPVELFMRDYFRHTAQVSHVVAQFHAKARARPRLSRLVTAMLGHRMDHLRVGPAGIVATRRSLERLRGNLAEVLRLVDLANRYDKPISAETWEFVRQHASQLPTEIDAASCEAFLSLLECPARLGQLLRDLHETAILERFIPPFAHARGLLQFNQYHKYTVDEHCLRAVELLTEQARSPGPVGQLYQRLPRKRLLHLAMLIHDLGKGFGEDHVSKGAKLAMETAQRLGLPAADAESLRFLVAHHQTLGHMAFRRDTSDEQLIVRFAVEVGSPELLKMLFLMTAADFGAVGPDVWDDWKAEIVLDLYRRTMQHLAGDATASFDEHLQQRRLEVAACLGPCDGDTWWTRQLGGLPAAYLDTTPARQVVDDLRMLHNLGSHGVQAHGQYLRDMDTLLFTVATSEDIAPGIFHRLTGALTSLGLEIRSAQINTLGDRLVIDRFWVSDPDYTGEPPAERLQQIERGLADSLRSPTATAPVFRRTWKMHGQPDAPTVGLAQTRVQIDNASSEHFTIVDIFAHDRTGLLYVITRRLFELGLSVGRAKIATHLDQVLDVFYVTDQAGAKVKDERRLEDIRRQLLDVVETTG